MHELKKMKPVVFKSLHRAKFSDLDPNGHVNTQCYLDYFLDHRFIGLRESLGLGLAELSRLNVTFFVCKVVLEFHDSVRADEEFSISSVVSEFRETSCSVQCSMKQTRKDSLVAKCEIELVCVDAKTNRPVQWPEDFKSRFFVQEGT